jgi:hypothetical protein
VVCLIAISLGPWASIDSAEGFEQSLIFGIALDHELPLLEMLGLVLRLLQNLTNLPLLLRNEPYAGLLLANGQDLTDMRIVLALQLRILHRIHAQPIHSADLGHRYLDIIREMDGKGGLGSIDQE